MFQQVSDFFLMFLSISLNIHFGCLKESSYWDGSFEYPQNMIWLRNKKEIFWFSNAICSSAFDLQFSLLQIRVRKARKVSGWFRANENMTSRPVTYIISSASFRLSLIYLISYFFVKFFLEWIQTIDNWCTGHICAMEKLTPEVLNF